MSYQFELDNPKDEAAARMVADIGELLQQAFSEEKASKKLTLRMLADRLEVDRSHVHRLLSGHNNMTLRTLAELVWGLDREAEFVITDPSKNRANAFISPHRTRTKDDSPPSVSQAAVTSTQHAPHASFGLEDA